MFYLPPLYFVFHDTFLRNCSTWRTSDCEFPFPLLVREGELWSVCMCVCVCVGVYSMLMCAWVSRSSSTALHACHIQNSNLSERGDDNRSTWELLFDEYSTYFNSVCSNMHNCVNKCLIRTEESSTWLYRLIYETHDTYMKCSNLLNSLFSATKCYIAGFCFTLYCTYINWQ